MGSAKEEIIPFLFLLIIGIIIYLAVFYFPLRGPAADLIINSKIDASGNISKYSIIIQFEDVQSYSQFLQELNKKPMQEILSQEIVSKDFFKITNDSKNNKITITSIDSFDPNQLFTNIKLKKSQTFWEYEDNSIINSSYFPLKYVNKLTYNLQIPSDVINATTFENSTSIIFPNEKTLTWSVDQNKNPINPFGNNIPLPKIYAKFKIPSSTDYSRIIIGGILLFFIVIVYLIIRR